MSEPFLSITFTPHGLTAQTWLPSTSSTHTRSTLALTSSGSSASTLSSHVVEDLVGPPVESDDRRRAAAHEHGGIAGDGQQIASGDVQTRHGDGLVEPVGADAPQVVTGADPPARRRRTATVATRTGSGRHRCRAAATSRRRDRARPLSTSTTNGTLPTRLSSRRITETEVRLRR